MRRTERCCTCKYCVQFVACYKLRYCGTRSSDLTLKKWILFLIPVIPVSPTESKRDKQHAIVFHVDDLKSSHVNGKVNDEFAEWLEEKHGEHGRVKVHRGKVHDYLGMTFDCSEKGKVKIDMTSCVEDMLEEFPKKLQENETAMTPAADNLFAKGHGKKLNPERADMFHRIVAKGLFVCKRARPDMQPTIAGLCTRVKEPDESDWSKLVRLMKCLNGARKRVLALSADDLRIVKWCVDAAFAVHPDFKSHTGGAMTFGKGAALNISRKQKLNAKSSTHAETVAADDASVVMLWTKLFVEAQGYAVEKNVLYQDNKSAILLEENGRKSAGKRSRALNIRYFFLTDQVEKGNLSIEYCPADEMWGDFHSKPLQGEKFRGFGSDIVGEQTCRSRLQFAILLEMVELAVPFGVATWWCGGSWIDWSLCDASLHLFWRRAKWQPDAMKGATAHPVHRSVLEAFKVMDTGSGPKKQKDLEVMVTVSKGEEKTLSSFILGGSLLLV